MKEKYFKTIFKQKICTALLLCTMVAGILPVVHAADVTIVNNLEDAGEGRWMSGEYHCHTTQSNDAGETYASVENVLNAAFREDLDDLDEVPDIALPTLTYGDAFDYLVLSDHLRNSPRNPDGTSNAMTCWEGIQKQLEKIEELQNEGKYSGKIIYSGFEWDMMALDHAAVAIIDSDSDEVPVDAIHEFEWLYSYSTSTDRFTGNELEEYGERQNDSSDKASTFAAIEWLSENYPDSYVLPNHPSRHNQSSSGVVTIEDLRIMNDIDANIVFGFEGMPGNQMSPENNRGEMTDVYGGADLMIAEVGGVWDALLGEGRHFWNFANSDFHFKISSNGLYSSGYWPSEYSHNYTWVVGNTFKDVIEGMRSGKSFSVYGDLINALGFTASNEDSIAEMGGDLYTSEGDTVTIIIRFKSPEYNNYKAISTVSNEVNVDHIDLISGEVTGKVSKDKYATSTRNETTKVVARFTSEDWGETDEDGYYTVTYTTTADTKNRYYRIRGTNLGLSVDGETDEDGNPLQDESYSSETDDEMRFNLLNDRNYSDMWFYSNPIFVVNDA